MKGCEGVCRSVKGCEGVCRSERTCAFDSLGPSEVDEVETSDCDRRLTASIHEMTAARRRGREGGRGGRRERRGDD